MNPIRIGILGYGNLGRGIELAVAANDDMELVGVFTRRDPATVHPLGENVAVWPATELAAHTDDIDVLMLAGGSATDLPEQTPAAAALYNVVDSFDTHANIPAHFAAVDAVARETGHVAVISVGWDPGMFSVSRVYANAIMPNGADYTFWGRGVSQGHSDAIRRIPDGWNRGYETLKTLVEMGHPDVGFGMTVQDRNAADLVPLYKLSDELGMEFATASLHNSFYFVEAKNIIKDRPMVAQNFEDLVNELLKSNEPKKWFRAYFNMGLINYIYGQKRLLPCDMAFDTFFIDPYGDVMPCNGTKEKLVMGNLNDESWDELWESAQAEKVRGCVRHCDRNCWMIGSVSPAMHKYIWKPASWVLAHKLKPGKKFDMHELPIVRDYESGKVTKEELDALSTCDMHATINDGLSDASRADAHVYETEEAL